MRQDPSNPYVFYTLDGERITIRVKSFKTSPLVVGAGPPTFFAHPPDFKTNTRTFEFTEANPPDVDAITLVFSFVGTNGKAKYSVTLSSSEDSSEATIPPITEVPGLTVQHLGILFLAHPEAHP
jgi:hypothetical protein